jgi:hypothetical protein
MAISRRFSRHWKNTTDIFQTLEVSGQGAVSNPRRKQTDGDSHAVNRGLSKRIGFTL